MSMSGDELKIPLRIDTSQVESDLRRVDAELARLERRVVTTFNRLDIVGRGPGALASPATGIADIRSFLSSGMFSREAMENASPQLKAALRDLERREQALHQQAASGRGTLPLTERQAALGRLGQVERQNKPVEVSARAEFFDRMAASLRKGLPNYGAMIAARGNVGNAGMAARMIMGLVGDNPLVAGPLAVGAGALAINAQQANFQRTQAQLASALVGGPAFGSVRQLMGLGVMAAGQGIDTWPQEAQQVALGLAGAGAGKGGLLPNLSNVLMLAQPNALPVGTKDDQVTPLVATLATAGGMSHQDINRVLQQVAGVAGDATGSLQELLGGMTALSHGAVGAARDVMSLAAIQHIVGPSSGINAGALMSGVMGATGSQALQAAGMLGMSPQAFMNAQSSKGGMATIWDRISQFTKRLPRGAAGTLVAEDLLAKTGLLNMQGLNATQQQAIVADLQGGKPGAAAALAAHYAATTTTVTEKQSWSAAAAATDRNTSALDRFTLALTNWWTSWINGGGSPLPPPVRRPGWQSRYSGRATIGVQQINAALAGGMTVSDTRGGTPHASASIVGQAWAAANGNPQLFAMMMATMARESDFSASAVSPPDRFGHRGYGIAQWTDPATARKYLGANWQRAAMDPSKAIPAMARYEQDLLAQSHGNVQAALAAYNGSGPAAQSYGAAVYGTTQQVEHTLHITVTVKDDRNNTLAHQVNHARVVPGHVRHGPPPPVPPGPGRRR